MVGWCGTWSKVTAVHGREVDGRIESGGGVVLLPFLTATHSGRCEGDDDDDAFSLVGAGRVASSPCSLPSPYSTLNALYHSGVYF